MNRFTLGISCMIGLACLQADNLQAARQEKNKPLADSSVRYTKTIEPNRSNPAENEAGKRGLDARFFGDFNAQVEFLFEPPFNPATGFRIYQSGNSYVMEVKKVANYEEVIEQLRNEFPLKSLPKELTSITDKDMEAITEHNREMMAKNFAERLKRYRIETVTVPVSDTLAERLYGKVVKLLHDASPEEKTPGIIFDGDRATFRCVVNDNEVWTLRYHVPSGELKALSDLFRQMIADVEAGKFNEAEYLHTL